MRVEISTRAGASRFARGFLALWAKGVADDGVYGLLRDEPWRKFGIRETPFFSTIYFSISGLTPTVVAHAGAVRASALYAYALRRCQRPQGRRV